MREGATGWGFTPGTAVALREIWHGRIWSARPALVVEDANTQMFYVGPPMRWMCPREPGSGAWLRIPQDAWELGERTWDDTRALSFAWPGRPHAVLLMWDVSWLPRSWYVNLQDPLRRTPVGFDYLDLELDAIVDLDRSSWRWKDEDELAKAIERGHLTEERATGMRAEGEDLVRRIVDRTPPFDRDWLDWRPHPSWGVPELPAGWDVV